MSAMFDRVAAEAAVDEYDRKFDSVEAPSLFPGEPGEWMRHLLDALEGCVRPAPAQTIDCDALTRLLLDGRDPADAFALRDAVLALLRPVDGVTLTREEAALAAQWARECRAFSGTTGLAAERALAARLEAAS